MNCSDEAADRRRASVESVPYGTSAVTTIQTEDVKTSDVSSCPPIALNDKLLTGSPSGEVESCLKEAKATTTEQKSGPILENPNGHSSPAPSSCSPAPPAMQCMNGLFTIPSHPSLVILISAELNQLRVVSIYRPDKPLRTLLNMNQPRDLQLLDPSRALILCNRELFVYNIEQGKVSNTALRINTSVSQVGQKTMRTIDIFNKPRKSIFVERPFAFIVKLFIA